MATERDLRRRRLWFRAGVTDLGKVSGRNIERYACPLCLRTFDEASIARGELTDEHVPPASVGGRRLVLTCRPCNSVSGYGLDAHLAVAEAHLDLSAGPHGRPVRGTFTIGDAELIGTLGRDGEALIARGVPQANRPGAPEAADRAMTEAMTGGGRGHINFRSNEGWTQRRVWVAWTRAAYLAVFAVMGYAYILQPGLDDVRSQIADPDGETIPSTVTVGLDNDVNARRLLLIEEPEWLKSIAVTMRRRTAFLPVAPDPRFFARLASRLAERFTGQQAAIEWSAKEHPWPKAPFGVLEG
jgi:hypothetical protein